MSIILLAGMPGAGKEEFLKVAREKNFDIVRMGDIVRKIALEQDVPRNDIGVGQFAHDERERFHYGIWAERTLSEISKVRTVIDGVRSYEEVEIFKAELQKDMQIVAIHASPDIRFERLKKRGREDSPENWKQFRERDERELYWGLGKIIAVADKIIVNERTLTEFHKKVDEFLNSF